MIGVYELVVTNFGSTADGSIGLDSPTDTVGSATEEWDTTLSSMLSCNVSLQRHSCLWMSWYATAHKPNTGSKGRHRRCAFFLDPGTDDNDHIRQLIRTGAIVR